MSGSLHVWTIGDARTASTRLRVHQYLTRLAADGIHPRVRRIPNGFIPRLWLKASLRGGDRLLIQKKLFSPWELERLADRAGRLLYDVDDAVYLDGPGSSRNRDRWRAVTGAADRVLAGNEVLAAAAARPERVEVLPTPVDTGLIRPVPPGDRTRGLLAWIGSRTNLPNLDPVFPAFARVAARRPGARLVVMADVPPPALPEGAVFAPWSEAAERDLLQRAVAGIMPLDDTPFNRGKCGFKILLYQAAGLAVAASPVGVNPALVTAERDGFLPASGAAWEEALDRLAGDPALAARLGAAGRDRVVRTRSVETLYPRFRAALLEETDTA